MRFTVAGIVLYGWLRLTGTPSPSRREWLAATFLGALIFLLDYGCLFWAEQRVPSGIAAVVLATIPVFITLMEIIFLRTQRLTVRLSLALLVGLCGVAVLVNHSFSFRRSAHQSRRSIRTVARFFHLVYRYDSHAPPAAAGLETDERGRSNVLRRTPAICSRRTDA